MGWGGSSHLCYTIHNTPTVPLQWCHLAPKGYCASGKNESEPIYVQGLIIVTACIRPAADGFHPTLLADDGCGALHHRHSGVDCHLVVVECRVGVELDRVTCR